MLWARMLSAVSRAVIRLTGAAVAGSKREFSGSGSASAPIKTVTVVGGGQMGCGIAQVSSLLLFVGSRPAYVREPGPWGRGWSAVSLVPRPQSKAAWYLMHAHASKVSVKFQ